jgi:hypothetical protein
MSQLLHDTFEEIAGEVGAPPAPAEAARAAWRTGRRRVVRRRLTASVSVAVVVLAVAALVWQPHLPPALDSAGSPEVATGHPLRVTRPWFIRELPSRGKPLAGLALSSPSHDPYSRSSWLAIDVGGGVHALPAGPLVDTAMPAVSPDGRMVAYGEKDTQAYVVRNVVDGTRQVVDGLRSVLPETRDGTWTGPAVVASQVPAYWAPDGRHLAARISRGDGTEALAVISADGSMSTIPWTGAPLLAGWVDDTRVLAVSVREGAVPTADVATVDVGTGERRPLPTLQPARPFGDTEISQWSPAVSPDGRRLALSRHPFDEPLVVAWSTFDLATGAEQGSGQYATGRITDVGSIVGLLQWRGDDVVATIPTGHGTVLGPGDAPAAATMLVDPRLDVEALLMAQRALAGPAHGSLWGHGTNWAMWRWRECLVALLGLTVVTALWRRRPRHGQA